MIKKAATAIAAVTVFALGGCGAFTDPTPELVFFELDGPAGAEVMAIYSTQFVAGVDEFGTTGVQVFVSDTVFTTLPIDTVFNIEIDRQWFVLVQAAEGDTLNVEAIVDVDDRNLVRKSGGIFVGNPWTFVYMFNRRLTESIEVII